MGRVKRAQILTAVTQHQDPELVGHEGGARHLQIPQTPRSALALLCVLFLVLPSIMNPTRSGSQTELSELVGMSLLVKISNFSTEGRRTAGGARARGDQAWGSLYD